MVQCFLRRITATCRAARSKHALIASVLCLSSTAGPLDAAESDPPKDHVFHYDGERDDDGPGHTMTITTNSQETLEFRILRTNQANNSLCRKNRATLYGPRVSAGAPEIQTLNFRLKESPSVALYEWHICFEIDGTIYRAWRGFDPGPNTALDIQCFIDVAQLATRETRKYMCTETKASLNPYNHNEYAEYCWSVEICRSFEDEREYELFLSRGPQNVGFMRSKQKSVLSKKTVPLTRFTRDEWAQKLKEDEADWHDYCLEAREKAPEQATLIFDEEKSCAELAKEEMKSTPPYRERGRRLRKDHVLDAFQIVRGSTLLEDSTRYPLTMARDDNLVRHFYTFAAHEMKESEIYFHEITCTHEYDAREAECELAVEHAFFADDPTKYFAVGDTTHVEIAIWAERERKRTPIEQTEPSPLLTKKEADDYFQRVKQYLAGDPRVVLVEETRGIVTFSYRGHGCFYTSDYQIIGDLDSLKHLDTDGICI